MLSGDHSLNTTNTDFCRASMKPFIYLLFFLIALVSGCAAPYQYKHLAEVDTPCSTIEEHYTSEGKLIPSGYACEFDSPRAKNPSNFCTLIPAYIRKSGEYVRAHYRCRDNFNALPQHLSRTTSHISTGGPVSVRGYYRKDGTYVRPHTRRR